MDARHARHASSLRYSRNGAETRLAGVLCDEAAELSGLYLEGVRFYFEARNSPRSSDLYSRRRASGESSGCGSS